MPKDPVVVTRARGDTEITPVSSETEVKIPWLNYLKFGRVMMTLALIGWGVGWLLWSRYWASRSGYWRWLVDRWWPWFSINWTWVAVTLLLAWIGPSVAYALYLLIEIVAKRTPAYTPWPSEWGVWRPQFFKRFVPPGDEPELQEEMETETINLNLWDLLKGRKSRKRMRQAPELLVSRQARTFYRSVAAGTRPFSQRGAQECGISRRVFDKRIFGPLKAQGLASWKNEQYHNQGINLAGEALVTLEHLGRGR